MKVGNIHTCIFYFYNGGKFIFDESINSIVRVLLMNMGKGKEQPMTDIKKIKMKIFLVNTMV